MEGRPEDSINMQAVGGGIRKNINTSHHDDAIMYNNLLSLPPGDSLLNQS